MSTTDTTLVIILTCLLSIFLVLLIAAAIVSLKLLGSVKRVVARAEEAVDTVEATAAVIKRASGKMSLFQLIKNIFDLVNKK